MTSQGALGESQWQEGLAGSGEPRSRRGQGFCFEELDSCWGISQGCGSRRPKDGTEVPS